jgi:outer membrane immunogenic protein
MRTIFVTAVAILAMSAAADAADLARVRPYPARLPADTSVYLGWSGFYIGVNAGGGIANSKSDFSVAGGTPFASVNNYLPGAVGGGQAGFNWQTGAAVAGLETDIQASSLKAASRRPVPAGCAGFRSALPTTRTCHGSGRCVAALALPRAAG